MRTPTLRIVIPALILGGSLVFAGSLAAFQRPERAGGARQSPPDESAIAAATYEHIASAIIELDAAEDSLVKNILSGYALAARAHLRAAAAGRGDARAHLEGAAAEIANVANEGDARIRAVRQRLLQAGLTHNTDESTDEDYMFIDSQEKKALLDLAMKVGRAGSDAGAETIGDLAEEFDSLFDEAIAAEDPAD